MQQVQRQQLQQKFSPQQIQLMKLLQLPVTDLEQAIKEEVEKNPLLDAEPPDEEPLPSVDNTSDWDPDDDDGDDFDYDYREHLPSDPNASRREFTVSDNASFTDRLLLQLSMLPNDLISFIQAAMPDSADQYAAKLEPVTKVLSKAKIVYLALWFAK